MHGPGFMGGSLEVAATALGIDEAALRDALHDGKTIAEVANGNDVDIQTVIDAMVDAGTKRIDDAVADGRLPQHRADDMKAHLQDAVTALVNGERPTRPHDGFGDHLPEEQPAA